MATTHSTHSPRPVYIYGLTEPGQFWNVRYIGKTVKPLSVRLLGHMETSRQFNTHKCNWLKSLARRGLQPEIRLLDIGDETTWQQLEQFYIAAYRQAGFDLTNETVGGDGAQPGSVEVAAKISASNKGRSVWNKGKPHSPETRRRISQIQIGRKASPETRAKMSAVRTGKKIATTHHRNKLKTHCPQGHPYDEDNTYLYPGTNHRQCKICRKANKAAWDAKHRDPTKVKPPPKDRTPIPCACGCGTLIAPFDRKGRPRRYAHRHKGRRRSLPKEKQLSLFD